VFLTERQLRLLFNSYLLKESEDDQSDDFKPGQYANLGTLIDKDSIVGSRYIVTGRSTEDILRAFDQNVKSYGQMFEQLAAFILMEELKFIASLELQSQEILFILVKDF